MMDWESDPELKEMRRDFVASFTERREELARLAGAMADGKGNPRQTLQELLFVAHRLAGTALTYGFPFLTEVGAALEDWAGGQGAQPAEGVPYALLLAEVLEAAERERRDPPGFEADDRLKQLLVATGRARK